MKNQAEHRYNWRKDEADARDVGYENRIFRLGLKALPAKVDLTPFCSPVENQGPIGSCTANALVGNLEFLEKKAKREFTDLSRLFIYFNERALEGSVNEDRGASLRDGIKSLHQLGVCDEKSWPYQSALILKKPNLECYKSALGRRISSYESLKNASQLKDCLASGYPFVFGFRVYSAFESAEVAKTGELNLPQVDERIWAVMRSWQWVTMIRSSDFLSEILGEKIGVTAVISPCLTLT